METVLEVRNLYKKYSKFTLQNVSFSLEKGKITGFVGRNGAGKSTTLNALFHFIHPNSGEILFWGDDISKQEMKIKQKIGFVSSNISYYPKKKLKTITKVTKSFYKEWNDNDYKRYMVAFSLDEGKTIFFSTHITSDLDRCADNIIYIKGGRILAESDIQSFVNTYQIVEYEEGQLTESQKQLLIGARRGRNKWTALVKSQQAESLKQFCHKADLEAIMVHLEKEEA